MFFIIFALKVSNFLIRKKSTGKCDHSTGNIYFRFKLPRRKEMHSPGFILILHCPYQTALSSTFCISFTLAWLNRVQWLVLFTPTEGIEPTAFLFMTQVPCPRIQWKSILSTPRVFMQMHDTHTTNSYANDKNWCHLTWVEFLTPQKARTCGLFNAVPSEYSMILTYKKFQLVILCFQVL